MDETYKNYLRDLGFLVKEFAETARQDYLASSEAEEAHRLGYLMAFHRVVTLMQQQAESFDIPISDLCLEDLPEDFFLASKAPGTC
jgi:hypothetical protein